MPIVLTQNEATESGHDYGDVLGVSYEYPTMYAGLIRAGERFVYYRGRRRRGGGTGPQAYLGTGTIGHIGPSATTPDRLVCGILDYEPFPEAVAFRDQAGYVERSANEYAHPGLFFRRGVRAIDEDDFARILRLGHGAGGETRGGAPDAPPSSYASPEVTRAVDALAMSLAESEASRRFPGFRVQRMPHNNPGFDLAVDCSDGRRFIEVKGTTRSAPHFFLSEGERRFSIANADRYALWVFFSLDLEAGVGRLAEHAGAISTTSHGLTVRQWSGVLPAPLERR